MKYTNPKSMPGPGDLGHEYPPEWDRLDTPEFDKDDKDTWVFSPGYDQWVNDVENGDTLKGYEEWVDTGVLKLNPVKETEAYLALRKAVLDFETIVSFVQFNKR